MEICFILEKLRSKLIKIKVDFIKFPAHVSLKCLVRSRTLVSEPQGFMSKKKEEKLTDNERLDSFIVLKMPNLIVVAKTSGEQGRTPYQRINRTDRDFYLTKIPVELTSIELSKLFETSKLAEYQLGTTMPGLVKQSISLARYVQDPLLCYTQLCN